MNVHKKLTTLDVYCTSISRHGRIKRLTREEEVRYFSEISDLLDKEGLSPCKLKRRDLLMDKITRSCLPYVIHLAQSYCRGQADPLLLEELIAAGNVGLCRSVYKFNFTIGTPFYNYASNWIKAELRLALKAYHNIVKKPANSDKPISTIWVGDGEFPGEEEVANTKKDYLNLNTHSLNEIDRAATSLPVLHQIVFRLHSGLATGKVIKFTSLSTLVGCQIAYVKKVYSEAFSSVQKFLDTAVKAS